MILSLVFGIFAGFSTSGFPVQEHIGCAQCDFEETLYLDLVDHYDCEIFYYDSDELSLGILENRDGRVIVERVKGVVLNDEFDGKILNPYYEDFDYISYSCLSDDPEVCEGTYVTTYFIYNPKTDYVDDIIDRWDYYNY